MPYGRRLSETGGSRRLYTTVNGYLGLGPEALNTGDRIYLLKGARVPFVFRSADNQSLELVGESYVHGFMNGEMLEAVGKMSQLLII
ncbi:uncharacterized protein K452DRAFT_290470 [Aplosporella prunicola CBS 121167]|uniref:Uncharacterized protein n=1 Tax=Aplosporella prunicola CBS 121167 TaxID=1176127 RepID=A0A6A6B5X9_9PEZI|nr:uncharacterized protein K452DRAFT_290470 [Aplosporella prunicola CBS 121167]KAF2138823.1 hypothetical protein K452DRAFT_290470 [Aplosporella prunicola CBS 121167]